MAIQFIWKVKKCGIKNIKAWLGCSIKAMIFGISCKHWKAKHFVVEFGQSVAKFKKRINKKNHKLCIETSVFFHPFVAVLLRWM